MKLLERIPSKFTKSIQRQLREISALIKTQREALSYTQEQLSEELGVSVDTIRAIELGRRYPSLPMLIYMLDFLQIACSFASTSTRPRR